MTKGSVVGTVKLKGACCYHFLQVSSESYQTYHMLGDESCRIWREYHFQLFITIWLTKCGDVQEYGKQKDISSTELTTPWNDNTKILHNWILLPKLSQPNHPIYLTRKVFGGSKILPKWPHNTDLRNMPRCWLPQRQLEFGCLQQPPCSVVFSGVRCWFAVAERCGGGLMWPDLLIIQGLWGYRGFTVGLMS